MMYISQRQEAFSVAYAAAVAAAAGFRTSIPTPDDDSVDMIISARGPRGTIRSPRLELQIKCQLGLPEEGTSWAYDLKIKNYDDLRHTDYLVPRALVIVTVPEEVARWTEPSEEHLRLRHCAWWVSLRGLAASTNTSTVRVQVPRHQYFDVDGLSALMQRISDGGAP